MRVAINTLPLQTGHKHRGSGAYLRLLLESLNLNTNCEIIEFSSVRDIPKNVDCIHYPFFDPFFLTLDNTDMPLAVTVHDLIPIAYPERFPKGIKGTIKWHLQKNKLKRAQAIITDSLASKTDIVTFLNYPEEQIAVIPLAADNIFQPVTNVKLKETIIKKYDLPKEFLLYVGDINWNKNIEGMLTAIKTTKIPLVVVGKAFLDENLQEARKINQFINKNSLNDKIIKLGFVESDALPVLYSLARATLAVSFAEGFGFPVLESMACGTPSIVSNCSSLKEIAGPSILVDPWNVRDIERGIKEALTMDKKKLEFSCIQWAATFSWKRVAEQTFEVYKKII